MKDTAAHSLNQNNVDLTGPQKVLANFFHALLRPLRAMALAYGYVLSGKKVETPYQWSDI